jgi:hypothetical protein
MFIPLSVEFWDEADAAGLTLQAARLYQQMCMTVKQMGTDGVIKRSTIRLIGLPGYWHSLKLLINSGWIIDKGTDEFYIHGWFNWNDSLEDVYAARRADRHRKRVKNAIPRDAFRMPD